MKLIHSGLLIAAFCAIAAPLAAQQNGGRFQGASVDQNAKKLKVGTPKRDLSGFGHVIAPGIVFSPTVTLEAGYNTNPDEFFDGEEGAPYALTNSTNVLGFVQENGATTVTFRNSLLQFDGDVTDPSRWDAGVAIDNAYAVGSLTLATFGAYYLRDELSLVASDNAGGYGQLAYRGKDVEAFARAKVDQIGYLGSVANSSLSAVQLALLQPSQFSMRRAEGVAGFIRGSQAKIGFYGEFGGANLDYYDQGAENILDRDADEVWGIAGVRFKLHPTLVLDAGWRVNLRDAEDTSIDEQVTHYFDGRLSWRPKDTLRFVAEVDRKFLEPLSTQAIMTDRVHYGASVFYKWRADLEMGMSVRHDLNEQIGDTLDYHETEYSASLAYQWNEKIAVYGVVANETVKEQSTGQKAHRLQVGGGTRIKF